MNASCLACSWTSLVYVYKHSAVKAADKHYALYHGGRSCIIRITGQPQK